MKNLLESAGFLKESDLKFRIDVNKLDILDCAIEFLNQIDNEN
jgi:hypothetical protein